MKRKIRVGLIFGGKSSEHEVSLLSAKNIIAALDPAKYEIVLLGIDKAGAWHIHDRSRYLLNSSDPKTISLAGSVVSPVSLQPAQPDKLVDVVFPILHGKNGEDGTMQGLLEILDIPFVGPGVLGSAVGMDKDVAKRLWRDAGIPVAKFITVRRWDQKNLNYSKIKKQLGLPLFVKPANAGSSVGVTKVFSEEVFYKAVSLAFKFDEKILIEEFIKGREVEVGILGNEFPKASTPGEVIPRHEFYSYEAKYIDDDGASVHIPAKLTKKLVKEIQTIAIKAFTIIECEGMARVDFFVTGSGQIYLNEINTIPGFTNISMYPKLWEASGISYKQLIDHLIELAMQRHQRQKKIKL